MRITAAQVALRSPGPMAAAEVPTDAMASDDARGVVRQIEQALHEHPEVSLPKRSRSPSPAQLLGRMEIPRLSLPSGLSESERREAAEVTRA
eukprot:10965907-Alexandrium_andersonii.AAC.1